MKTTYSKFILIVCLTCSLQLFSQGYQSNFQGQTQIAMGSTGSALPHDASAFFYNPGSASFLEKSSISVSGTGVFAKVAFQETDSKQVEYSNSPVGTPFTAYFAYKQKEDSKAVYGLGVYTPFGSTISYENDWIGRYALQSLKLKSIYIQPSFSYKVTDKIGLGVGIIYALGEVELQRAIPLNNNSYANLSGKTNGFGFNAGIYFKASEKWSFAATYKSKIQMNIDEGNAVFVVPSSVASSFPNGKFTSSLPLPAVTTIGASFKLNHRLTFASDINYIEWKAYDSLIFDYETNTTSLLDTKSAREYKNTFAFRLGSQYQLNKKLKLRAGIVFGLTPVPDGRVTPETPDNNRINYSIGFGYSITEKFKIDASVLYTTFKREDTNLETLLSGTFKTIAIAPGLSLTYQF
jgi:long-chain fatty acid transport protein